MSEVILENKPKRGDWIMVDRGLYYHHGVYESDDVVYQFASPEGSEISPDTNYILRKVFKGWKLRN